MTIRCAGGIVVKAFTDSTRILQNGLRKQYIFTRVLKCEFLWLGLIQSVNSFYKKYITELLLEKNICITRKI